MSFTYFNPVQIHFDIDFENILTTLCQNELKNKSILLVTTQGWRKRGIISSVENIFKKNLIIIDSIQENPELSYLQDLKRDIFGSYEAIIALGGGSVLDGAKFFALQNEIRAENGELNILSDESKGIAALPIFAFPTTAGTGSEATKWATIWDKQSGIKYSLSHTCLYPKMAFYDIDLMMSLPPKITLHTALDTLSHAIESIWNKNANSISTHYAKASIELILEHLVPLMRCLEGVDSKICHCEAIAEESKDVMSDEIFRFAQHDKVCESSTDLQISESSTQTNATTKESNSKIFDEKSSAFFSKCGLQEKSQGSYLEVNDRRDFSQLPHLSSKAELLIRHLRKQIALSNLYAALAFSNTQTALAHAISYPITMQFGLPHGLACSFSLPLLLDCIKDTEANLILQPYKKRIKELFTQLKISHNPRDYGLDSEIIEKIFSSLNSRAKNGLLDITKAQEILINSSN